MEPEDYVSYLSTQARSGAAVFHEFRLLASQDGAIHSFFEGEADSLYYVPIIRRKSAGQRIHLYVCDGKSGVAAMAAAAKMHGYDKAEKCLFFVDRDYDDFFDGQPVVDDLIHVTEPYSVESYLVSAEAIEVILKDFCGFSDGDAEMPVILAALEAGRKYYQSHMLTALAWALACREAGEHPNFANVQLQKMYTVSADGKIVRRANAFKAFRKACIGGGASPPLAGVRKWVRRFKAMDPGVWIRGKFELWFFETLTVSVVGAAVATAKARGKKRVRVPATLIQKQTFDMLGGRLTPANSVDIYIERQLAA